MSDPLSTTSPPDLLLHVCCAPCSIVFLEHAAQANMNLVALYYNPNVHPAAEYCRRRDTFMSYAASLGVAVIAPDYQPEVWEKNVSPFGGPHPLIESSSDFAANDVVRRKRCAACYRLRFRALAQTAVAHGISRIASTLSISPYQFTALINAELARAAAAYGCVALPSDHRKAFAQAQARARELGMYRQNYCGCRFSAEEAQLEREARRRHRQQCRARHCMREQPMPATVVATASPNVPSTPTTLSSGTPSVATKVTPLKTPSPAQTATPQQDRAGHARR